MGTWEEGDGSERGEEGNGARAGALAAAIREIRRTCTYPDVPEPRTLESPIPLYMVARDTRQGGGGTRSRSPVESTGE